MGTQEPRRLAQGQTAEVDDDGQGARSTADGFALIEGADTVSAASIAIADERLPAKGPHTNWRSLSRFRHAASEGPGMGADLFALGEAVDGLLGPVEEPHRALDGDEDKIAFVQGSAGLLGDGSRMCSSKPRATEDHSTERDG